MANGKVYLVGAGPGDPGLLTVEAMRLLQTADVVFHDDLVSSEVLSLVPNHVYVENVGKRCGRARIVQQQIHALMINAAREGWQVVRLKSGAALPGADLPASLVEVGGHSFLVYPNYETILDYNCAHLYALSVGMLADRLQ